MLDVLIREASVRFGLGDKALPVLQMLLARMTAADHGGLQGFLDRFKAAGLGPLVQSWLGGGPSAQPISNSQLETVLGASGGLLPLASGRLGLARDDLTSAIAYLLPVLVGKLTPGGSVPSTLPEPVRQMAAAGVPLLAAPAASASATNGNSLAKWLPWAVVVLAILFGLSYLGRGRVSPTPAAAVPASAAPAAQDTTAPAASEPVGSEVAPASAQAQAPAAMPPEAASAASQ